MSTGNGLGPVLVTGGAGWLGSAIVEALLAEEFFGPVYSSYEPNNILNRLISGAVYRQCDISDAKQLTRLLDEVKPRVVVHTVGAYFFSPPKHHYRVTYDLSKQLIAIAKRHPSVQALVYTGTAEAVNLKPSDNIRPVKEDQIGLHSFRSGPNAYARTKAAIDVLVREANTPQAYDPISEDYSNALRTTVLRVTGLYGPRDRLTMDELLKHVNTSNTGYQLGPNSLVHDWIHVDNCARAHVLAAKALLVPLDNSNRADGEAFFISDGKPKRFWDFVHAVWAEAGDANWKPGGPRKVTHIPIWIVVYGVKLLEWVFWIFTFSMVRPSADSTTYEYMKTGCWFDIGKARMVLGYEPIIDTDEGIRRTVAWYKENGKLGKKNE